MAKINASTVFVFVGENKIAKTTAYQLSVEMSQLDSTSNTSGFFKDHITKVAIWTISTDALTIFDGYSYSDLYNVFVNKQRVWLSIGDESNYTLLGLAAVESLTQTAEMENAASFAISFKGVGELYPTTLPGERYIIDELFEIIIDQDSNFLIYT